MRSNFQFKVRTWLLLGLLPALTAVALWIGWGLYGDLRRIILEGFDRRLTSPSVVVAAFVDSTAHQWLSEQRHVRALTYAEDGDVFYALADFSGQTQLVELSPETGRIPETGLVLSAEIKDLAFDSTSRRLIGLTADQGELVWIDRTNGRLTRIPESPAPVREIADAGGMGGIWIMGEDLKIWDPRSRAVVRETSLPAAAQPLRLMGAAADGKAVMLLDAGLGRLMSHPLADGGGRTVLWTGENALPQEPGYDAKRKRWVMAQEKLRLVDIAAGHAVADSFVEAYGREDSDAYRDLVAPLIRLHDRLGLSFIYTQVVEPPDHIIYVADSPESGTYSPLMSQDLLPPSEVAGITRLQADGTLHFTQLEQWEQWGWLKSAFAPIFNAEGDVVAMAGTDFNASVIENSTHRALLAVFLIGGLTLVIASLWSLVISKWLRRPIEELQAQALNVAAGDFRLVEVKGSREVNALAAVFNRVSSVMKHSVVNLTTEVNLLLKRRDRAEVQRVFVHALSPGVVFAEDPTVSIESGISAPGGVVDLGENRKLVWWEDQEMPTTANTLVRMASRAGQVKVRFGQLRDAETGPDRWPEGVEAVLWLDTREQVAVGWSRAAGRGYFTAESGSLTRAGVRDRGPVLNLTGYKFQEVPA